LDKELERGLRLAFYPWERFVAESFALDSRHELDSAHNQYKGWHKAVIPQRAACHLFALHRPLTSFWA